MDRRYTSYLVRYWSLSGDRRRLEVIHIQTGERAQVDSLAEALAWLADRARPTADDQSPTRPDQTAPSGS